MLFEHNGAGEIKLVAERAYELVPALCHAARKPSVFDRVLSYYFIVLTNGSPKLHAVCSSFQGKDQGGVSAAPCKLSLNQFLVMYCWDTNSIFPLYSIMLQPLPISLTKATAVPFASCIMAVPLVLGESLALRPSVFTVALVVV